MGQPWFGVRERGRWASPRRSAGRWRRTCWVAVGRPSSGILTGVTSVSDGVGTVYLIGAGPGDPGLFTLKGKRCLEEADVVAYDALANPRLLVYAKPDAEMIYVGKRGGQHALPQEEIGQLLVERARAGKVVARLKGGD